MKSPHFIKEPYFKKDQIESTFFMGNITDRDCFTTFSFEKISI